MGQDFRGKDDAAGRDRADGGNDGADIFAQQVVSDIDLIWGANADIVTEERVNENGKIIRFSKKTGEEIK